MIASVVLPVLFAATGLFAVGCLFVTWRAYGAHFRAIRAQLAGIEDYREFTVRLALTETREYLPVPRRAGFRLQPAAALRRQRHAPRVAA
jgi:hypothetical protein